MFVSYEIKKKINLVSCHKHVIFQPLPFSCILSNCDKQFLLKKICHFSIWFFLQTRAKLLIQTNWLCQIQTLASLSSVASWTSSWNTDEEKAQRFWLIWAENDNKCRLKRLVLISIGVDATPKKAPPANCGRKKQCFQLIARKEERRKRIIKRECAVSFFTRIRRLISLKIGNY